MGQWQTELTQLPATEEVRNATLSVVRSLVREASNFGGAVRRADDRACAQWSDQPRMHGDEVRAE